MSYLSNRCSVLVDNSSKILVSDADYAAVVLYKGYSDNLLMIAKACIVISMIIGIPGNFITIVALANYKKVRNATAIFIMNMSFAELLFLCMDPPVAVSLINNRSWTHGSVLCQQYPIARLTLVAASVFTTIAITINRYMLIIYPRLYRKIYRTRNIVIMLTAIWVLPLLILLPTYLGKWGCFDLDLKDGICSVIADQNKRSSKTFIYILGLALPCIPIIYCYTRIFFRVRKVTNMCQNRNQPPLQTLSSYIDVTTTQNSYSITNKYLAVINDNHEEKKENISLVAIANLKSEHCKSSNQLEPSGDTNHNTLENIPERLNILTLRKKKLKKYLKLSLPTRKDKRLGTMILAILISFALGHLPTAILEMIRGITPLPQLHMAARILLYFSPCFNPVIYVVMSKEYKKAYRNLFRCFNIF